MSEASSASQRSLRIVHILRSPVGGLFRHVVDLSREQIASGHAVGLVVDAATGGERADRVLAELAPRLALGITRVPMRRDPHPSDLMALARVWAYLRQARPDVVHGHGAKGALYARLPAFLPLASRRMVRIYTPHGGSLHYDRRTLKGAAVLWIERLLAPRTDMILFESIYAAERFGEAVGQPRCPVKIVHNGLHDAEFAPVRPAADAVDVLFVGEFRRLKGVDVLLEALGAPDWPEERPPRALLVGAGPDRAAFEALAISLGIADRVTFHDPMPAREAFALGHILVVPSRAESMPYIVLEAAAAQMPMIASQVGGIPEIMGGLDDALVPSDDPAALAVALRRHLARAPEQRWAAAEALAQSIHSRFSASRMGEAIVNGYRDALAQRQPTSRSVPGPALRRVSRYGL